jgi:hypothetical protein
VFGTLAVLAVIGLLVVYTGAYNVAATELAQVYWIAKHGVKMAGMPAFGPSHDDHTLWSVAAFVKELPAMTPERYAGIGGAENLRHGSGGHGG